MKKFITTLSMAVILMTASTAHAQFEALFAQMMIQQAQTPATPTASAAPAGGTVPGYTTDWASLEPKLSSADILLGYEQANFKYDSKAGNSQPATLTPAQTNAAHGGSCADYSALTSSVLKNDGYQQVQEISYMWGPGQGHVVTMYLDGGVDKIISNGQYVGAATDQSSLQGVLAKAVGTTPSAIGNNIHYLPAEYLGGFDNNYKQ